MPNLDAATRWVAAHVDSGLLPGAVLGVASRDGVIAVEAFGDARAEDRYPIFSITKPLVGMLAARHIDAGRLSLDTPLTDAVPGFGAGRDDVVRLRHLGSHSSGIVEPELDDATPLDEALLVPGRTFEVGTAVQYSSLAFHGIARLVEHAGGRPWEDQLETMLDGAGAAGLTMDAGHTSHVPVMSDQARIDWERFCAIRHPGAGASAAMEDMLAIARSLLADDGRLLSPGALAVMREPLSLGLPDFDQEAEPRRSEWGFTWNLRRSVPGLAASDGFGHAGWDGTELWMHPDHDVAFVLLTNVLGAQDRGLDPITLASALTS
ncbi:serine hydrolase [Demequina sp. NBRC 110056]|uniref:serine hydrolase domain-containing protein n=1 Tax=Demequina sp. NBRC 110056 TaxID=1570345 RepID=UPI00117C6386|nr:serine hydrolase domain-containing protein [Demequina sp. NBRC 110056]